MYIAKYVLWFVCFYFLAAIIIDFAFFNVLVIQYFVIAVFKNIFPRIFMDTWFTASVTWDSILLIFLSPDVYLLHPSTTANTAVNILVYTISLTCARILLGLLGYGEYVYIIS